MKKLTGILLALALLLSGCSGPASSAVKQSGTAAQSSASEDSLVNKTGYPIVNEPITIKGLVAQNVNVSDWNEHPAMKHMEELTGIKIEWECVPDAGFKEKLNLAFASNSLPDIIMRSRLNPSDEMKYASSGQIVALDQYKEYAPNFYERMESDSAIYRGTALPDGHIYSLPQINYTEGSLINHYWLNKKWLDNLGMPEPTTTDELFETLIAFRDKDPNGNGQKDEIPYVGICKEHPQRMFEDLLGSWGIGKKGTLDTTNFGFSWLEVDDNSKVNFYGNDDRFKDMVGFFQKMWAEGLIDKESYSMDQQQAVAKVNADQVGYVARSVNTVWMGAAGENYVQPPVLKGPFGDRVLTNVWGNVQVTGTAVITSSNKYPEATMRWLDYFYSKEGTVLLRFGIEGKSYDVVDGKYVLKEEIKNDPNGLTLDQALGKWALFPGGALPQYVTDQVDASAAQLPETKAANDVVRDCIVPHAEMPLVKYTEEESRKMGTYAQDILNYTMENVVKFITGERPMSEWDAYVAEFEKMPLEEYVSINQAAYDRWKSA